MDKSPTPKRRPPKPQSPPPPSSGPRNRPTRAAVGAAGGMGLSAQEEHFAVLIVSGQGKTSALRQAFEEYAGWKPESQHTQAWEVSNRPHVAARIANLREVAAKASNISVTELLQIHLARVQADPRELVSRGYRCCRHCHGRDHGYQRSTSEMHADRQRHADQQHARVLKDLSLGPDFDEAGGTGWDETAMPNPSCPTCRGKGELRTVIGSFDNLSPEALTLFNGIRESRDGVQVLLADKDASLNAVARHKGFFAVDNAQQKHPPIDWKKVEQDAKEAMRKMHERQDAMIADRRKHGIYGSFGPGPDES